ncbi:MAG TPA: hypothetical protein VGA28_05400 [Desulfurivibrionaceae bacterium]|jgi:hypothetical protein
MEAGIALLLTGASADLSATIHAVELARRTTKILHAVCRADRTADGKRSAARERQEEFVSLATKFANQEGIRIHTHILERLTGEPLIRFLCAHRIFCLVLGVKDRKGFERKTNWVNLLREQLQASENWYLPDLWSVIMTPWDASTLEHAISKINSRT